MSLQAQSIQTLRYQRNVTPKLRVGLVRSQPLAANAAELKAFDGQQ